MWQFKKNKKQKTHELTCDTSLHVVNNVLTEMTKLQHILKRKIKLRLIKNWGLNWDFRTI